MRHGTGSSGSGAPPPGGRHGPRQRSSPRSALRCRTTGPRRHVRRVLGRDPDPLCRPLDRVRSAVVLLTGALLAVALAGACAVALAALRGASATAAQQRLHRHLVPATTVSAAVAGDGYDGTGGPWAQARWSYPAGSRHSGLVAVPDGTAPGSTVRTWVDDAGRLSAPPRSEFSVGSDAAVVGTLAFLGQAGVVALISASALSLVGRRADRAWESEWARIEPGWSGRTGRRPHGAG